MEILRLVLLLGIVAYVCKAGVTEIPSDSSEDETIIETVSDDTWMPSNIFDVKPSSDIVNDFEKNVNELKASSTDFLASLGDFGINLNDDISTTSNSPETTSQSFSTETSSHIWDEESSPIFRAIRDFIFQASDGVLDTEEEQSDDTTEEIVKIIEKGLIEATTMFLNPSEEPTSTTTTTTATAAEEPSSDISIVKIENVSPDTLLDRMGMNVMDLASSRQTMSVNNITVACSNCYTSLQVCVQKCFTEHNCHDVQRQVRACPPPPPARLCNIFTQWGPVDECKVHEDCPSPLLCCNDGCINKCSDGIWQD